MNALRSERGSALVSALVLLGIMIGLGLAVYAAADTQDAQSGQERKREAAFGLAEATINAQIFQLTRAFPGTATGAYPATCNPTSGTTTNCPAASTLQGTQQAVDFTGNCNGVATTAWTTMVRDNPGTAKEFYDPAVVEAAGNFTWDQNADGAVWIRADATAGCRRRSVVTLVRSTEQTLPFPRNVVTSQLLRTTNNGKKVIIDTAGRFALPPQIRPQDPSQQPSNVSVRCTQTPPSTSNPCLGWDPGKGQVAPDTSTPLKPSPSPLYSQTQVDQLIAKARSLGTYYGPTRLAGEPVCPPLTGEMVYIVNLASRGCNGYTGGTHNNSTKPGVLFVESGTLDVGGNFSFFGIIYMRNTTGLTGGVLNLGGNARIQGAVNIDGPGGIMAGSSSTNIIYDPRVPSLVKGLGNATAAPNTWRELPQR